MLGAEAREANKVWLMKQVNSILEPLMLAIVRDKPNNKVGAAHSTNPLQIEYMVKYIEREYGERALNGDLEQAAILSEKIEELQGRLDAQKGNDSTADSRGKQDDASENETDSDVSAL